MLGLFVLGMAGIWVVFSIWLGFVITKWIFKRFVNHTQTEETLLKRIAYLLSFITLTGVMLFSPFLDQLIAYPKWQQLCSTTNDFEWGPGMDKSSIFGREYYGESEIKTFTIFPNVSVTSTSMKIFDANTNELLFIKPHYNFSALPLFKLPDASGGGADIFLHQCSTYGLNGKNYEKEFQLEWNNKKGHKK